MSYTEMRDLETQPYTPDEQRVAAYLRSIMPDIGTGDDPITFLIASHAALLAKLDDDVNCQ